MGTIEKGFMGGFKGLLGPAVGSKWKGKAVIKSRPPKKEPVRRRTRSYNNRQNFL